ncbi:DUF6197 family protein [Blastococcus mobilis]|uniref:Uncharacterized protein n=1 Tax=Blastococcus mobilis TaxID=1938746 RepID=A0A238VGU2_9ACTN|nr:hypothetical protein [Blastococcus mobilis]SNR32729.1 hypothetical protein SAMN06272737_10346 [Blastococcus mobilis]
MPTLTADAVLRAAADHLDAHPEAWGKEFWRDPATGCRCSGGLIALIVAPDDQDGDPYALPLDGRRALATAAIEAFEAYVHDELLDRFDPEGIQAAGEPLIGLWNDRCARDAAHVAATMRAAADRLAPCTSCHGQGGWQQPDGLIVECPRGCMTGGAA